MGNFRQNSSFGGGGRSGGRSRDFGGRDSGRPQMHSAVCDECGNNCEVPFKPTGDKPIFCNDCFKGKRGDDPRRSGGRDSGGRSSGRFNSGDREMHSAICDKCGEKCQVPFKPSGDKPIYCSDCFAESGGGDRDRNKGRSNSGDNKQLEIINNKLDKILKSLGLEDKKKIEKTIVVKPEIIKAVKEVKEKKVTAPKKVKTPQKADAKVKKVTKTKSKKKK